MKHKDYLVTKLGNIYKISRETMGGYICTPYQTIAKSIVAYTVTVKLKNK